MEDIAVLVQSMIEDGKKVYTSKDLLIKQELNRLKEQAKKDNEGKVAYHNKSNPLRCDTCGSIDKNHPDNGYCFVCNTDNWADPRVHVYPYG